MDQKNGIVTDAIRRALFSAAEGQRLTRHRSFWSYLCDAVRHTPFRSRWMALLTYFRRVRMVALILRLLSILFAALGTGALVLLGAVLLLVILPVLALAMLTILLIARIRAGKANRCMLKPTEHRRICVFFQSADMANAFLLANARDLIARGYTVILVSPHWISARGVRGRGRFYCTAREEFEHLYLVRRYYFFHLCRHVLVKRSCCYVF